MEMSGMRRLGATAWLVAVVAALAVAGPARADVVDDNVAPVLNKQGTVELFARGTDGEVYTRPADGGEWTSLGGAASSGPAAMQRADGALDVFVRGMDDKLYQKTRRGSSWSDWTSLDGLLTSAPAATERRGTGAIELFARGHDNALWHRAYLPGQGWGPWGSFGGQIASGPTVVSRIDGWADLFVRWSDNRILQRYFDRQRWSDWFETTPSWLTISAPSATVPSEGRMEVFHRGRDRALWQRSYDGVGFGPGDYRVDSHPLESSPAAVADPTGRIRLYAREGENIIVKTLSGGGWSAWERMGPVGPPARSGTPTPGQSQDGGQSGGQDGQGGGQDGGQGGSTPPPPAPPVAAGDVKLGTGLSCTPRGQRMDVSVDVRKRPNRAKPRVQRVVFYYRKGKGKVARTDRKAPYKVKLPVDLEPGTYRVHARIYYKRGRKSGRKTVSRRFAVCS